MMSTTVNTIKWLLVGLLISLVLTYLVALNMENQFVIANSMWLSHDFLFAVSSGTFASLFVVLICELIKYKQLKFATEAALFSHFANLYGQILIIKGNCKRALKKHDTVADNLIQPICNNAAMAANSINGIDYTPFCKKDKINELLLHYRLEKHQLLMSVLAKFIFLQVAIHKDALLFSSQSKNESVTSDCPNINTTLKKVMNQTATILTYLDLVLLQIDEELGGRYHWNDRKLSLNTYQDNFVESNLEDYLKEDSVVF